MPSLPFTFEDITNPENYNPDRTVDSVNKASDPTTAGSVGKAQTFLTGKLNQLRDNLTSTDGLIDLGLAYNPVTRVVDMASKFFGGPGVAEGFKQGVTQPVGDERSGKAEVRVPPMPF